MASLANGHAARFCARRADCGASIEANLTDRPDFKTKPSPSIMRETMPVSPRFNDGVLRNGVSLAVALIGPINAHAPNPHSVARRVWVKLCKSAAIKPYYTKTRLGRIDESQAAISAIQPWLMLRVWT